MKTKVMILIPIFVLLISIVILTLFTYRVGPLVETIKERYGSEFKYVPSDANTAISINDEYKITKDIMKRDREFLLKWFSNPESVEKNLESEALRRLFENKFLDQNLIIIQALKEKALDDQEFDKYIWINIRDLIIQYYLTKKINKENPNIMDIKIDDKDINTIYERNKNNYDTLGLTTEQAKENIRQAMMKEKMVKQLKIIENSLLKKLKLEYKIKSGD